MKQREGLARALAVDSATLLMDEPFGSVDAQTRRLLQRELLDIGQETGKTILLVTHDIEGAILLGDQVLGMRDTPKQIRESRTIDATRPRDRTSSDVMRHKERLLRQIDAGDAETQSRGGSTPTCFSCVTGGITAESAVNNVTDFGRCNHPQHIRSGSAASPRPVTPFTQSDTSYNSRGIGTESPYDSPFATYDSPFAISDADTQDLKL